MCTTGFTGYKEAKPTKKEIASGYLRNKLASKTVYETLALQVMISHKASLHVCT